MPSPPLNISRRRRRYVFHPWREGNGGKLGLFTSEFLGMPIVRYMYQYVDSLCRKRFSRGSIGAIELHAFALLWDIGFVLPWVCHHCRSIKRPGGEHGMVDPIESYVDQVVCLLGP